MAELNTLLPLMYQGFDVNDGISNYLMAKKNRLMEESAQAESAKNAAMLPYEQAEKVASIQGKQVDTQKKQQEFSRNQLETAYGVAQGIINHPSPSKQAVLSQYQALRDAGQIDDNTFALMGKELDPIDDTPDALKTFGMQKNAQIMKAAEMRGFLQPTASAQLGAEVSMRGQDINAGEFDRRLGFDQQNAQANRDVSMRGQDLNAYNFGERLKAEQMRFNQRQNQTQGQGAKIPQKIMDAHISDSALMKNLTDTITMAKNNPGSLGAINLLGDTVAQRANPEGIDLRGRIANLTATTIHDLAGATQTAGEIARLKPFIPNVQLDSPEAIVKKLEGFQAKLNEMNNERTKYYPALSQEQEAETPQVYQMPTLPAFATKRGLNQAQHEQILKAMRGGQ
jgi:hypothetical protein